MKITIYGLLGLVKDGKAPKIIKYANYIWTYEKCVNDYTNDSEYLFADVMSNVEDNAIFLNDTVEILEEQKKIPDEINVNLAYIDKEYLLDKKDIDKKINEIINRHNILVDKVSDYLESKGE